MIIPDVIQKQMKLDSAIETIMNDWRSHIIRMFLDGKPVVELSVKSNAFRLLCQMAYMNDVKQKKILPLQELSVNLKKEAWDLAVKEIYK